MEKLNIIYYIPQEMWGSIGNEAQLKIIEQTKINCSMVKNISRTFIISSSHKHITVKCDFRDKI